MGFDKGDKFIDDAKQRAHDAIGESNPKLTSLEKGFLHAMKRRQAREKHARKGSWNASQQLCVSKRKAFLTQEIYCNDYSCDLEAISIKSTLQK